MNDGRQVLFERLVSPDDLGLDYRRGSWMAGAVQGTGVTRPGFGLMSGAEFKGLFGQDVAIFRCSKAAS